VVAVNGWERKQNRSRFGNCKLEGIERRVEYYEEKKEEQPKRGEYCVG
jgi:hypothetical protein